MKNNRNKRYNNLSSGLSEYQKGYLDGQHDTFEASELDAYYAGVGFGKRLNGDKHLGFTSAKERDQFEKGIRDKDEYFNSYRTRPLSFWERLTRKKEGKKINYDTPKSSKRSNKKFKKRYKKNGRRK